MTVNDPNDPIDRSGDQAEDAAAAELRSASWETLNLNQKVAGHFPVFDLVVHQGADRALIQVRGTKTDHGSYRTPPQQARRAELFGQWLGRPALYAFVHFTADSTTVRFETASRVATLAEAAEADYPGINRYHVSIDQFDVDASRIAELLDPPSSSA
ncbi:MAG: hypothetical protein ACR2MP_29395 [Streptosporangiaceae bacterium]